MRLPLLCRTLGHAGDWHKARVSHAYWHSQCRRCQTAVRRSVRGGAWLDEVGGPTALRR